MDANGLNNGHAPANQNHANQTSTNLTNNNNMVDLDLENMARPHELGSHPSVIKSFLDARKGLKDRIEAAQQAAIREMSQATFNTSSPGQPISLAGSSSGGSISC